MRVQTVKVLRDTRCGCESVVAGQLFTTTEETARLLVGFGVAEFYVEAPTAPAVAPETASAVVETAAAVEPQKRQRRGVPKPSIADDL